MLGLELIGQNFADARYFHGRPSATSDTDPNDATKTVPAPYNAANSSGSNAGPTAKALIERVQGDATSSRPRTPNAPVPVDLVTTSAQRPRSAHLRRPRRLLPGAARRQGARPAGSAAARAGRRQNIEGRLLGVLGEPRVNVLQLNMALDALAKS